jgi:hypothetical protein
MVRANISTYVFGSNSRLAEHIGYKPKGAILTGLRARQMVTLPPVLEGKITIFSDPPSLQDTKAGLVDLLSRIPLNSNSEIVFISSISASFKNSTKFPYEGRYALRKRLAEELFKSRGDLNVTIVRVGNVFAITGWKLIRQFCPVILLPPMSTHVAAADLDVLNYCLGENYGHKGFRIIDAYRVVPINTYFSKIIYIPGLMVLYRSNWGRPIIKLLSKMFRKIGIYFPSPDDLNSFLEKN